MNDLKTLYTACSDKDELAQIAEKLGINKDNANLSTILNEILNAIPEILNVGPLTERRTEISEELYEAIRRTPLIIANDMLMVISDNQSAIDNEASDDSMYTGIYTFVRSVQFPNYTSEPTFVKGCTFCRYDNPDTGDQKCVVFLQNQ